MRSVVDVQGFGALRHHALPSIVAEDKDTQKRIWDCTFAETSLLSLAHNRSAGDSIEVNVLRRESILTPYTIVRKDKWNSMRYCKMTKADVAFAKVHQWMCTNMSDILGCLQDNSI